MLAGVSEAEPDRIWFGSGGCVEEHDDGTFSVFVRGELVGVFGADDVASRDVLIAVVLQHEKRVREEVARAFRVSPATVGRVVTRFKSGGFRAVADYGRQGGRPVRTPELDRRLSELFAQGLGPRRAHRAVAKHASYGTVQALHAQWLADRAVRSVSEVPAEPQQGLELVAANDVAVTCAPEGASAGVPAPPQDAAQAQRPSVAKEVAGPNPAEGAALTEPVEPPPKAEQPRREPSLEEVAPGQRLVQHVGSWMVLGLLNELGVYEVADRCRGDTVSMPSLRRALDATAIALAIGEECVEGVRRIETPSAGTLLRHTGGVSASWTRRVLHGFADQGSTMFQATMASRLLARTADGEAHVVLYVLCR